MKLAKVKSDYDGIINHKICGLQCKQTDCYFNQDKRDSNPKRKREKKVCLNTIAKIKADGTCYIPRYDVVKAFRTVFRAGDVILIPDRDAERRSFGASHHKKNLRFIITKIDDSKFRAFGKQYSEPTEKERYNGSKSRASNADYSFVDLLNYDFKARREAINSAV